MGFEFGVDMVELFVAGSGGVFGVLEISPGLLHDLVADDELGVFQFGLELLQFVEQFAILLVEVNVIVADGHIHKGGHRVGVAAHVMHGFVDELEAFGVELKHAPALGWLQGYVVGDHVANGGNILPDRHQLGCHKASKRGHTVSLYQYNAIGK